MSHQVSLSETDRIILSSYFNLLDGLADYFGKGYEIVLHSLENFECSAIKVINGHFTGRKEGAPITDLALNMLSAIEDSGDYHEAMIYSNRGAGGTPIRSATLPITGEQNKLIGLLCINFYMDIPLSTFLESLTKTGAQVTETYANDSDELILSLLESAKMSVLNNASISASNRNKEIIAILAKKNVFNLKDAVVKVAGYLGISKNTVYMHLRNLQNE